MSWSTSLLRMKPPCVVKPLHLCSPKATRSRKRRRDSCFHNLNGYRYHCLEMGACMKLRGVFLLAVVLCGATQAMAQPARTLPADRIADKLWWIIDITKEYQPQFQAHVTLEAPDGERLALTFPGESARTLVHDDVIALERKPGGQVDAPEQVSGAYFIPHLATWGKPRWWSARAKHEGQEISKAWKL